MLAVALEDAADKIQARIDKGQELLRRPCQSPTDLEKAKNDFFTWSDYNEELLGRLFTSTAVAEEYSRTGPMVGIIDPTLSEERDEFRRDVSFRVRRLESIHHRLELFPVALGQRVAHSPIAANGPRSDKVFIVHGHDDGAREATARFIAKLGLQPVILHEQASGGRTVIEKLEHHADVGFAIVLLTPDDVGGRADDPSALQPRARQNVILELGFFVAKLGREYVCALHKGAVELPSDILGVVYIAMDATNGWKLVLARELREAGFPVDMNDAV